MWQRKRLARQRKDIIEMSYTQRKQYFERNKDPEQQPSKNVVSTIKTFLHPTGRFLQIWNPIFVLLCVIAVSVDPLFLYIPVIHEDKKCIDFDKRLKFMAFFLRSVTDLVYLVNIILQFFSPFFDESSQKFGRTKLVTDSRKIARRYLRGYFPIDFLATVPIPQVIIPIMFSIMKGSKPLDTRKLLNSLLLFQYVPRVLRIYLSWKKLLKSARKINRIIWLKAAFNFFLYILASHVVGAFWYFFSILRETACWHIAYRKEHGSFPPSFSCSNSPENLAFLNDFCIAKEADPDAQFDYGMFLQAVQFGILKSTGDFPRKLLYCFWWGLRNLSSLGENLQTSTYFWENCFATSISIFGLLLFLYFIGNVQTYMMLATERSEEITQKTKEKERDIEVWVERHKLPDNLKEEIMLNVQHRLEENRDIDVENPLPSLPQALRKDIKQYLCLPLLKEVSTLKNMGEQFHHLICEYLTPVYYNEHSYIVKAGEPVDAMLLITSGTVLTYKTRNGSIKPNYLEKGHIFGEELLVWGFNASPEPNLSDLPISTKTVKTHTKVEAFALMANDLKIGVPRWHNTIKLHYSTTTKSDWAASIISEAASRRRHRHQLGSHGVKLPSSSTNV